MDWDDVGNGVYCLTVAHPTLLLPCHENTPKHTPVCSLETEVKVHGIIAAKLKKLQDAYETTIAEDEALLEGDSLTHRQRLAVVVRLGEKKVLRHNFNLARTKLRQLKEAEESAAGLPKAEL